MRRICLALAAAIALAATAPAYAGKVNSSSHSVHQYTTKKGTVVHEHKATNPNKTKKDNYSTKGNTNPYTGKKGTKKAG